MSDTVSQAAKHVLKNAVYKRDCSLLSAHIDLGVFNHIDWQSSDNTALLMEIVELAGSKDGLSSDIMQALDAAGFDPGVLWKDCALSLRHVKMFCALVDDGRVSSDKLNVLLSHDLFQGLCLHDRYWSSVAGIKKTHFDTIKTAMEEHRNNSLWLLCDSEKSLLKARSGLNSVGFSTEEVQRWARMWNAKTDTLMRNTISPLLFSPLKMCDKQAPIELLSSVDQRVHLFDNLSEKGWLELLNNVVGSHYDKWLQNVDPHFSQSALSSGLTALNRLNIGNDKERRLIGILRPILKRGFKAFMQRNPDNTAGLENLLSLFDTAPQNEERSMLYKMAHTNQMHKNWALGAPSWSKVVMGLNFLSCAPDKELIEHSEQIMEFMLSTQKPLRENMCTMYQKEIFNMLKSKDGDDPVRPYLAQILWMNTFLSEHGSLVQRCRWFEGMKIAEERRPNLKLFYPPVYPHLIRTLCDRHPVNPSSHTPENLAIIQKARLQYMTLEHATDEPKLRRKM